MMALRHTDKSRLLPVRASCAAPTCCVAHSAHALQLLLTTMAIFFEPNDPLQVAFAVAVSFAAAVHHASFRPFRTADSHAAYYLQHGSLCTTFFVFVMAIVYKINGSGDSAAGGSDVDDGSGQFRALTFLLLFAVVGFLVVAGVLVVYLTCNAVPRASARAKLQQFSPRNAARVVSRARASVTGAVARLHAGPISPRGLRSGSRSAGPAAGSGAEIVMTSFVNPLNERRRASLLRSDVDAGGATASAAAAGAATRPGSGVSGGGSAAGAGTGGRDAATQHLPVL